MQNKNIKAMHYIFYKNCVINLPKYSTIYISKIITEQIS